MAGFADALAKLRGQSYPFGLPLSLGGSVTLTDGSAISYPLLYRRQPWVYAAVNKLAHSVARMPLKAYQQNGEGRQRLTSGPLADLLDDPADFVIPFAWKERIVKNVIIYGNAIVVKVGTQSPDDVPQMLLPTPALGWTVDGSNTYTWTAADGEKFTFPRWQVIHYRFWDLDESGFGISMLEPLRMTLAIEDAAQRLGVAAFKNSTRPAAILKTDQKLAKETSDRLKAEMQGIHGGVDNAFKMAVLQQGLDWAPAPSANLSEAAVIEHRKLTKEEVAAVFDVPQPTIGILDEANFASIDMLHTMLYQDSLGPWIAMIEETTQSDFVNRVPQFRGQFVEFDMNAVLRGDIGTRYRAYATAITSGFKTPNEIRRLENDPPSTQPEADQLLFPMNLSGAVGAQAAEDAGTPDRSRQRQGQ